MATPFQPIGQMVSHYRVLRKIGGGGMGVVFEAEDLKLGRHVALKFLPDELARDQEALERFRREARAASALNHPNICTIYEIDEIGGRALIAMELLEGQTLQHGIERRSFSVERILDVAIQISDALEAAHSKGIVHRDVKPANVFITARDQVKLLDFGLAKNTKTGTDEPLDGTPTLPFEATLTRPGTTMGTMAYMSPEQARGEELDRRSDLFSFGAVVYEMSTGVPPFGGATPAVIFHKILAENPVSVVGLNNKLPPNLAHIIDKALEKDRELRYQHASEMRRDLTRVQREITSAASSVRSPAQPLHGVRKKLALVTSILSLAVLAGGSWYYVRYVAETKLPPIRVVPLASQAGSPAFSPDGNQVAFHGESDSPKLSGIYIRQIGVGIDQQLQLTKNEQDCCPVWSPDGRYIAFSRYSKDKHFVYTISALGGAERKLSSGPPAGGEIDWSPDGNAIAFTDKDVGQDRYSIYLLNPDTLQKRKLTEPGTEQWDGEPAFSPDGKQVAFVRGSNVASTADIFLTPSTGGTARRLTFDNVPIPGRPTWTRDAKSIVFSSPRASQPTLWRVPVSGGTPVQIAQVGVVSIAPVVAPKGNRLAYDQILGSSSIWILERTRIGKNSSRVVVTASGGRNWAPQLSPDGKRVAFLSERFGTMQIWVCNREGSNATQLTRLSGAQSPGPPRWSPDGQSLAFDSVDSEMGRHKAIFVMPSDGGSPHVLIRGPFDALNPSWSHDGKSVFFASNRGGQWQIWKSGAGGGEPTQVTKQGGYVGFESADGKLYFAKSATDPEIWQMALNGGSDRLVSPQVHLRDWKDWFPVKNGILFFPERFAGHPLLRFFNFATERVEDVTTLEKPGGWISASDDGRFILYDQEDHHESDIMLLENFH